MAQSRLQNAIGTRLLPRGSLAPEHQGRNTTGTEKGMDGWVDGGVPHMHDKPSEIHPAIALHDTVFSVERCTRSTAYRGSQPGNPRDVASRRQLSYVTYLRGKAG
jgi:hypothetical protein